MYLRAFYVQYFGIFQFPVNVINFVTSCNEMDNKIHEFLLDLENTKLKILS